MSVMDEPAVLAKTVARWTTIVTVLSVVLLVGYGSPSAAIGLVVGVLTVAWVVGFYALIARFFARSANPLFPRMLVGLNLLKYPIFLLITYAVVQGGTLMVSGFVMGVVLPLGVLTGIAVRCLRA